MKNIILLLIFNLINSTVFSQNLVPNPSFEYYTELPTWMGNGHVDYAFPWFRTPYFPGVGGTSVDYINTNMPLNIQSGDVYELPLSGNAYLSFYSCWYSSNMNSAESFEVRLIEPMQIGETYKVSFYVKKSQLGYLEGACLYGSDELGVYFHTDTIYGIAYKAEHEDITIIENSLNLFVPDTTPWGNPTFVFSQYLQTPDVALDTLINDEENWYLVTDTVYADKPYEFMTFAQFRPFEEIQWEIDTTCGFSSALSRMLIDDVSVHLINEQHLIADAGEDTTICLGASVQIGTSEHEDYMYWWTPNEDMETSIYGNVNPGMLWVSSTETTTYTLTQKDFAFLETTDQITITVEECIGINEYENTGIKVYPNPVKNDMVIDLLSDFEELITLSIYDLKGTLVHQELVSETTSFISLNKLNSGTYIYKVYTDTAILHQDKLVKLPNN
jgi:hypothetical protein